jgi:glycerol-3-phosphate dehydrogenase
VAAPLAPVAPLAPLASEVADHLAGRYGTEAAMLHMLVADDPGLVAPLVPGLPYLRAEAVFAVRHEMACTLADVLDRRTRARLQAREATATAADAVARLIGAELGWDEARIVDEVSRYRAALADEREDAGLPLPHPA